MGKNIWFGTVLMVVCLASAYPRGNHEPKRFDGERIVHNLSLEYDYPVEDIFPLLCPVREYEWMSSWNGTTVYTESGFAEKYVVFYHKIPFPFLFKKAYWTATQYVPDKQIQWCITVPGICIVVIDETMENLEDGKSVFRSRYHITGLSRTGNKLIAKMFSRDSLLKEVFRARDEIQHYLATGTMLDTEYESDMFD